MSKEFKKFLFIFTHVLTFLIVAAVIISLFVTGHWILGLCVAFPGFATLIGYVESDLGSALAKKFYGGKA